LTGLFFYALQSVLRNFNFIMDLTKTIKDFLKYSPAQAQQSKYKERAKQRGLLSILELSEVMTSEDKELKQSFFEELQATKKLSIPTNFQLSNQDIKLASNSNGQIKKSITIYHNDNFHGIDLSEENLQFAVNNQNQEIINVNHSSYPEDAFGYFTNLKIGDDNKSLTADLELDTNHPAFAKQRYAMTQGAELGWSIEVTFGDIILSFKDWSYKFKDPIITGLASTMIPSAPKTLMQDEQLEEDNKTNQMDSSSPPTQNQLNMDEENQKVESAVIPEGSENTETNCNNNAELDSLTLLVKQLETNNQELQAKLDNQTEQLQEQATFSASIVEAMSKVIDKLEAIERKTQLKTTNLY
jgi:hypothetical protein